MFKAFLASTFGLKGIAIAIAVAFAAGSAGGVWITNKFCDAAAAELQVKSLRADLAAAQEQMKKSAQHSADLAEAEAINKDKINALERKLATLPAADVCRLNGDDVGRLRGIK